MRFAISGIARKGGRTKASDVCAFVRRCKSGKESVSLSIEMNMTVWPLLVDFERLTPYVRDLSKKQAVTSQSLEKIEDGNVIGLGSISVILTPNS
jgi:Translin family